MLILVSFSKRTSPNQHHTEGLIIPFSYYIFPLSFRSLEKVLGWSVHVIGVRGEHGNEMFSRVTDINAKTYISFIAVDTDSVTVNSKEVYK